MTDWFSLYLLFKIALQSDWYQAAWENFEIRKIWNWKWGYSWDWRREARLERILRSAYSVLKCEGNYILQYKLSSYAPRRWNGFYAAYQASSAYHINSVYTFYLSFRMICWLPKRRYSAPCSLSSNSSEERALFRCSKIFRFLMLCFPNTVVLCALFLRDLEEVIRRANNTSYGLAAGVFTNNVDTANTLTRALRAGTIWVNCYDVFDAAIPFGGYKMSGIGREMGVECLKSYLQVKSVVTPLKNPAWLWSRSSSPVPCVSFLMIYIFSE